MAYDDGKYTYDEPKKKEIKVYSTAKEKLVERARVASSQAKTALKEMAEKDKKMRQEMKTYQERQRVIAMRRQIRKDANQYAKSRVKTPPIRPREVRSDSFLSMCNNAFDSSLQPTTRRHGIPPQYQKSDVVGASMFDGGFGSISGLDLFGTQKKKRK
jgi:hypothetical protein